MCKLTIIATYKENVISAKTQSGGTIETLTCYGAGICNVICFLYSSTFIHFPTVLILMYYFSVSS